MPKEEIKYTTAKTSMLPGAAAHDNNNPVRNPKQKSGQQKDS